MFPAEVNAALALTGERTASYVNRHAASRHFHEDKFKKDPWWMRLLRAFVPHFETAPYLVPYSSQEEIEYFSRLGDQGGLYYPGSHPTLCTKILGPSEPTKLTKVVESPTSRPSQNSVPRPFADSSDVAESVGVLKRLAKAVDRRPFKSVSPLHHYERVEYLMRDSARSLDVINDSIPVVPPLPMHVK